MNSQTNVAATAAGIFPKLGLLRDINPGAFNGDWIGSGPILEKRSPIDGSVLATVRQATQDDYNRVALSAQRAFQDWRDMPAPKRGAVIHGFGMALREVKQELGLLVTLEAGKIVPEGEGEVQEMIDVCDFAVGLSRQLYGRTIASELDGNRMMEQWHPLGPVGIISAFNFPVAVWAWNSVLATMCGNTTIWKPSEKTPLTAIACVKIAEKVCRQCGVDPAIFSLVVGDNSLGSMIANDSRVPLVSATGSVRMGKLVADRVAARLGRSLLELGGNNALIVAPSANPELAQRAILFGAVGTAGQRCTTTRRLIVHESMNDGLIASLLAAYRQVPIGNPLDPGILMGPLIDSAAVGAMALAITELKQLGGRILYGGAQLKDAAHPGGLYVSPCIAEARNDWPVVQKETFAPILYVMTYRTMDEAIALNNSVSQGLSSAIFTNDIREAERFLSACGSDCGIANVNLGTSGAEIGGAFGGEKDTGGGRESGSDSWKAYMRRQTNSVNRSSQLPLAQGIQFGS